MKKTILSIGFLMAIASGAAVASATRISTGLSQVASNNATTTISNPAQALDHFESLINQMSSHLITIRRNTEHASTLASYLEKVSRLYLPQGVYGLAPTPITSAGRSTPRETWAAKDFLVSLQSAIDDVKAYFEKIKQTPTLLTRFLAIRTRFSNVYYSQQ